MANLQGPRKSTQGLQQAIISLNPSNLYMKRDPRSTDRAEIGTWLFNSVNKSAWYLGSITGGVSNWLQVTTSSGTGTFTGLSVTGLTTLVGPTYINYLGANDTYIGNSADTSAVYLKAGTGNMVIDGAPSTQIHIGQSLTTGIINIGGTSQTGTFTIAGGDAAQTINIANSSTGIKTVNIASGTVANVVNIGSITGAATTNIYGGTGGIGLVADYLELANLVRIYTGSGAPDNGLALAAGYLYINTAPTGALDRMFIATGPGAWTNFTTAA